MFSWRDVWVGSKALQRGFSSCSSSPCDKKPFLFSSFTRTVFMHYLLDKKLNHSMDHIDLLGSLSVMARISSTNSTVLFLSNDQGDVAELPYFPNHQSTHWNLFESSAMSSDWYPNTLKFSYWCFRHEYQHAVSIFLEDWITTWYLISSKTVSN